MTRRRKFFIWCLAAHLAVLGGCGVGMLALAPGKGPPVLSALPSDADLVAHAREVDTLWKRLESSERFAAFAAGPAGKAFLGSGVGRSLKTSLESVRRSGVAITRSRASHLVGREVGIAVWLSPVGRSVRGWVAAFRIDTKARIAELAAGRLFLTGAISRREEAGVTLASFTGGGASAHWCRLGDLLVAASAPDLLLRAVTNARAAGTGGPTDWSADAAVRFGLSRPPSEKGFHVAATLVRPEVFYAGMAGIARADAARKELEGLLRAAALPVPLAAASISLRLEGDRLFEEDFLRGASASTPGPAAWEPARPARTFFRCALRPGQNESAARFWRTIRALLPRGAVPEAFRKVVMPRVGEDVVIALAEQDVRAELGGFPAQFTFFRLKDPGAVLPALEQFLRARSFGIFEKGRPLPTGYPFLVRRGASDPRVYEIVIRNTRRYEGYRPAMAMRGEEVICSTSLDALEAYLAGRSEAASGALRLVQDAGTELVEGARGADPWLALEGERVLELEWRRPREFGPLGDAYDYFIELHRARSRSASRLLTDRTDYAELRRAAEGALGEVRSLDCVGVREPGGMRVRAVWDFGE